MADGGMKYCRIEKRDFPESEFTLGDDGVWWHERRPRHRSERTTQTSGFLPGILNRVLLPGLTRSASYVVEAFTRILRRK